MKTNPWSWSTGPINYVTVRGARLSLPPGWRMVEMTIIKRSPIKRDLRTPKYRPRVTTDRKKQASKRACRKPPTNTVYDVSGG